MVILMEKECWVNSQLSIARHYGGVNINGKVYMVVNKEGVTLRKLSKLDSKIYVEEVKAIPPGEPADLIDMRFLSLYKKMGRERFIEMLKNGVKTLKEAKEYFNKQKNK